MIAELGLAILWMAAALAALQLIAGALGLRPEGRALVAMVRPVAVMQGVLAEHLGLDDRRLATEVFPDSGALPRLRGLVG